MYGRIGVTESRGKKRSIGPFGKLTSRVVIIRMTVYLFFGTRSF